MTTRKQTLATFATLVATLLIAAPVCAAVVVGKDGKPIRLPPSPRPPPHPPSLVLAAELEPYVTVLLRPAELTPEQLAQLSERRVEGEVWDCFDFPPVSDDAIIITDVQSWIERLLGHPIGR